MPGRFTANPSPWGEILKRERHPTSLESRDIASPTCPLSWEPLHRLSINRAAEPPRFHAHLVSFRGWEAARSVHQTGGIGAVRNGFSTKDVRIQPGTVHSDRWAMMRRDGSEPSVSTTRITVKPAGSSDSGWPGFKHHSARRVSRATSMGRRHASHATTPPGATASQAWRKVGGCQNSRQSTRAKRPSPDCQEQRSACTSVRRSANSRRVASSSS